MTPDLTPAAGLTESAQSQDRLGESAQVSDLPERQPILERPDSSAAAEVADWKAALRDQFDAWLEEIDQLPEPGATHDQDEPDLYSFYEQLAAANVESRKSNRRTAEAFSQWAETLARFESQLGPLRESAARLAAGQTREHKLPRAYCLVLVEFLDRMNRLAKAFTATPKATWWRSNDRAWLQLWENQRQGFSILVSHLEELLTKEGVLRIDVLGQPFDPLLMTAVAVEASATHAPQTVLEEVAPGYRRRGELLRTAQVKVSKRL